MSVGAEMVKLLEAILEELTDIGATLYTMAEKGTTTEPAPSEDVDFLDEEAEGEAVLQEAGLIVLADGSTVEEEKLNPRLREAVVISREAGTPFQLYRGQDQKIHGTFDQTVVNILNQRYPNG